LKLPWSASAHLSKRADFKNHQHSSKRHHSIRWATLPYSSILAGMTDAETTGAGNPGGSEPLTQRVPSSMKGFI
jgi:hypothetical protein